MSIQKNAQMNFLFKQMEVLKIEETGYLQSFLLNALF